MSVPAAFASIVKRVKGAIDRTALEPDESRRLQHFTVFVVLGLPIMFAFAAYHLATESYVAVPIILVPALGLGGGWLLLVKKQYGVSVYRVNIILYAALMIYSLADGGVSGSQSLWSYTFPLIAFFLFGKNEGLLWNVVLFSAALFLMACPIGRELAYQYPSGFAFRFLTAYVAVAAIAYWFEFLRERYRVGMEAEQTALMEERERMKELFAEREKEEDERRRFEQQVQYAQKLESLGVLAGGIAHDFNNLLMSVLGNAELALLDLELDAPARESIKKLMKAANNAADLSQQMLAYSGRGHFVIEPVDLSDVVREIESLIHASVSKGASLEYDLAESIPVIEADATQLEQVVLNLITNASESFSGDAGLVKVSTGCVRCDRAYLDTLHAGVDCAEGDFSYVEVSDTGTGMDEDTIDRMFDPFYSTKFTGRGLGLAAVLGIVRGHNGAIQVSTELGSGTTVRVLFPTTDSPVKSRDSIKSQEQEPSGPPTVLIVDDEEDVLDVAQRMAEKCGFQVETAKDGYEAVELFKQRDGNIDCVLLDLTMPRMDGTQAFEELRKIRSDVRVLLASGYSMADVEVRFGEKGFAGFIQKPFRMSDLENQIRRALS